METNLTVEIINCLQLPNISVSLSKHQNLILLLQE